MLVEANSKPHDIVIYTDGSVTKAVHGQAGWKDCTKSVSGAHRVTTSSLTLEVEAVTHAIQWQASQRDAQTTCHHSHRLNEPPAKGRVWNGLPRLGHSQ